MWNTVATAIEVQTWLIFFKAFITVGVYMYETNRRNMIIMED